MTTATPTPHGVPTSPTITDLSAIANKLVDELGARDFLGPNRVARIAARFHHHLPRANIRLLFIAYLFGEIENVVTVSIEAKRAALINPDVMRWISYPDPTGEGAVRHVMSQRGY